MEALVSVDLDRVIQDNFLGVNGTYHGFAFMPEQTDKGMNDADRQREFERVARLDLKIARTWYRPDWAAGERLNHPFNWESPKMRAFYRWLDAMQSLGVQVALQAGWWFTRDTYYGYQEPDPASDIPRYISWVSESLHQMIHVRGFTNIRYLVLFTEPTSYELGRVPSGFNQWSYYARVVRMLHERLLADHRRHLVQFVGPNNTFGGLHLAEAVSELNDVIDIYSGHDYNKPDYLAWYSLCQAMQSVVAPTGKPLWLDEYGKQDEAYRQTPDYGCYIAQAAAASINAGNQSSFIWLLFDQQYVAAEPNGGQDTTNDDSFYHGVHRWGTTRWPHDTLASPTSPYPHWYVFSLLSRWMGGRGGTQVLAVDSGAPVISAATRPAGSEVAVLLINTAEEDAPLQVRFNRPLHRTLFRRLYDPATIQPSESAGLLPVSRTLGPVETSFSEVLPARGVAIFTTQKE